MSTTTHDRTVERLPWLVNGTLDADERREVEEHLAACADCRRELAATREAFDLFSAHLPPQVLLAMAERPDAEAWSLGGTTTVDRSVVDAHLAHCDSCREELAMARESHAALAAGARGEGEDSSPAAAPGATVAPFRRRDDPAALPSSSSSGSSSNAWRSLALAASILLAVVSAGGWYVASQRADAVRQELAELQAPRAGTEAGTDAGTEAGTQMPPPAGAQAGEEDPVEEQVRDLLDQLAAVRQRNAEMERTAGELEGELDSMRAQLADARPGISVAPYVTPAAVSGDVLRGEGATEGGVPVAVKGNVPYLYLTPTVEATRLRGLETFSYRLETAEGRSLAAGTLPVLDSPDLGRYVGIVVPTAGLPEGELELVLSAGGVEDGEPLGRFRFRVTER